MNLKTKPIRARKSFIVWRTGPAGPLLPFRRYRHDDRFITIPDDRASRKARVEAVAEAIMHSLFPSLRDIDTHHWNCRKAARAALAAERGR